MEEIVPKLCQIHKQPKQIFCQECKEPICVGCLSAHKKHEVLPATEAIKHFKKELSENQQKIQKKDEQLLNIFYEKQEEDEKHTEEAENQLETVLSMNSKVENLIRQEEIKLVTKTLQFEEKRNGNRGIHKCASLLMRLWDLNKSINRSLSITNKKMNIEELIISNKFAESTIVDSENVSGKQKKISGEEVGTLPFVKATAKFWENVKNGIGLLSREYESQKNPQHLIPNLGTLFSV